MGSETSKWGKDAKSVSLASQLTYRDVCMPINARKPAEAMNSIEETEEIWCLKTAVAAPPPTFPLTTKFPPIAIALRLDIWAWRSLDIDMLTFTYIKA